METLARNVDARAPGLWPDVLLGAGFLAAAVPLAFVLDVSGGASVATIASLTIAFGLARSVRVEVGSSIVVPSHLVFVPLVFVLPLGLVPLCVAAGLLLGHLLAWRPGQLHPARIALLAPARSWFALGPVAVFAIGLESPREPDFGDWPVYLAALATQLVLQSATGVIRNRLLGAIPPQELARALVHHAVVDTALAPVGLAVAFIAYWEPVGVVLVLPLVGLLAYFSHERKARIDDALELGHAYRGTVLLLGDVREADDSRAVVRLVLAVADRMGLGVRERQQAEFVALLHDVGKIRVPSEIINKPGPLTAEERAIVEQHTVEGQRMLDTVGGMLGEVGKLVRSCHERWDASGYPDGLAGEEIPLVSRIVCACDAYDAMTTERPYRRVLSPEEALAELVRCAGSQFDPAVVDAVVTVVGAQPTAARTAA